MILFGIIKQNMVELSENISWTRRLELYFSDTGEKASCLAWSHKRAENMFSIRRTYIDLPVIVLSSITGFLSVGTSSIFPAEQLQYAQIGLGLISLFVGVLNTTGSYFGWAKRAEGHRMSATLYSKLARLVSVQLALPRAERMTPKDLLEYVRDTYEHLAEVSPSIPEPIVAAFKSRFRKAKDITFPEELNGLEPITVFNEYDEDKLLTKLPTLDEEVALKGLNLRPKKTTTKRPNGPVSDEIHEDTGSSSATDNDALAETPKAPGPLTHIVQTARRMSQVILTVRKPSDDDTSTGPTTLGSTSESDVHNGPLSPDEQA